jgi:hypothetical protein
MTISLLLVSVVTSLGLMASLGLFVSLKREIEVRSRRESRRVEAMLARLEEAETQWTLPPPPLQLQLAAPRSSLNLSKRVQVMRLLRQGEDTQQIALTLGMSRAEVQLLASVYALALPKAVIPEASKAAGAE